MTTTISIREMLEDMELGNVFSLQVVKFNKTAGTGGDLLVIEEGFVSHHTNTAVMEGNEKVHLSDIKKKSPRHWANYTRNVKILAAGEPTGKIVKIHPPLVLIYKGKKVVP